MRYRYGRSNIQVPSHIYIFLTQHTRQDTLGGAHSPSAIASRPVSNRSCHHDRSSSFALIVHHHHHHRHSHQYASSDTFKAITLLEQSSLTYASCCNLALVVTGQLVGNRACTQLRYMEFRLSSHSVPASRVLTSDLDPTDHSVILTVSSEGGPLESHHGSVDSASNYICLGRPANHGVKMEAKVNDD